MKRSLVETIIGALVLCVAGIFLIFSYGKADVGTVDGYQISADFSGIGGLAEGDDVMISGVKIGSVISVDLVPETYLARVTMAIDDNYQIPLDTLALISSESLLGGRFLALEPGADEEFLEDGDIIEYTQAPQNLEQLLGQFIFSVQDSGNDDDDNPSDSAPAETDEKNL